MKIGILKETGNENRVAILPAEVVAMKKMGVDVLVENNAGERAFAPDAAYQTAGAILAERKVVISESEMLLSVNPRFLIILILLRKDRYYALCLILLITANGWKRHVFMGYLFWHSILFHEQPGHNQWIFCHQWQLFPDTKRFWKLLPCCQDSFQCSCRQPVR
jgi:hypothetical protein